MNEATWHKLGSPGEQLDITSIMGWVCRRPASQELLR